MDFAVDIKTEVQDCIALARLSHKGESQIKFDKDFCWHMRYQFCFERSPSHICPELVQDAVTIDANTLDRSI